MCLTGSSQHVPAASCKAKLCRMSCVKHPGLHTGRVPPRSGWGHWVPCEFGHASEPLIFPSPFLMPSSHLTVKGFTTFSFRIPFERVPLCPLCPPYLLMTIPWLPGFLEWNGHRLNPCTMHHLPMPLANLLASPAW